MTAEADCRAALYLRLSRDDTGCAGESESIANQRRLLHDYALREGWPVVAEYADDGVSGTTFDRPQFQKMLCEIPRRGINLILIKDLSRLGRDYLETGRYLERYFPEHGVRVVAVGDAVDTAREDIFLPMRNYINELYARDTSGKIRAALQTKMKDGRFIGHYAPYGYRRDPQERSRLVPDQAAAAVVRRLFAGAAGGAAPSVLAARLNAQGEAPPSVYRGSAPRGEWTAGTVRRILRNEVYLGTLIQGKTRKPSFKSGKVRRTAPEEQFVVPHCHEALVSQAVFEQVQQQSRVRRISRSGGFVNVFTGIAFCADCGRAMSTVGTRRKGSRADLACGGYKQHGRSACTRHGTNYEALEAAVLDVLHRHLALTEREKAELRKRLMHSLCSPEGEDAHGLRRSLSRTEDTIAALYLDRASGRLAADSFYAALHRLEEQAAALRRRLDMRKTELPDAARLESVIDECCCPERLTRELVRAFVRRIEVEEGTGRGAARRQNIRISLYFEQNEIAKTIAYE